MTAETSPAVIDHDAAAITRTVVIRASCEAVWNSVTVPELMAEWFADSVGIQRLEPGSAVVYSSDADGALAGRITEVDERSTFAFRWNGTAEPADSRSAAETRLSLSEHAGGTVLELRESGLDAVYPDAAERNDALGERRSSWDRRLDELAAILERQDSQ